MFFVYSLRKYGNDPAMIIEVGITSGYAKLAGLIDADDIAQRD